ncbi:MAG: aminotransferase class V-fold PLP-dependent enzyme [Gemmataceae bacterium]
MIYLDNAATSFPKPEAVYRAMDAFARSHLANPGRAGHKMALAAERPRRLPPSAQPAFPRRGRAAATLNCTDALNMAFKGVLREGDHVVTTDLEHNSVSRPLRAMELAGKIGSTAKAWTAAPSIPPPSRRRSRPRRA